MKLLFQGLSYVSLGLILSVSAGCGSEPAGVGSQHGRRADGL